MTALILTFFLFKSKSRQEKITIQTENNKSHFEKAKNKRILQKFTKDRMLSSLQPNRIPKWAQNKSEYIYLYIQTRWMVYIETKRDPHCTLTPAARLQECALIISFITSQRNACNIYIHSRIYNYVCIYLFRWAIKPTYMPTSIHINCCHVFMVLHIYPYTFIEYNNNKKK